MPIFTYKGFDSEGKKVSGKVTAENEIDVESKLREMSIDMLSSKKTRQVGSGVFARVGIKDKIMMCVQLQQLDRAGVPILDSLADLRDTTDNPTLKHVLSEVYEGVRGGLLLSEAFAKHPAVFDSVFTGLVAAGENTGKLHESFANLTGHLKWSAEINRKVKKAVTYPIFTLIVMVGMISFLMGGLVPQLQSFLKAQGQDMPGHTLALIATSDFFSEYWYLVLIVPAIFVIAIKMGKKFSYKFRFGWDAMILKLPIVGAPIRKIDLARFVRFFGILYNSGIDILDCLKISQKVVKNEVILDSIIKVRKIVSEGSPITPALRSTGQFPTLVLRMFKIGEDSGNMKDALENINFFYDQEVNDAVDTIIGVIKPALTLFLGAMLAWIVIAMFGPLYDTINQMQL